MTPHSPLSPMALAITQSRQCRCQVTVDEVQQAMAELRRVDALAERKQQGGCVVAVAGAFGVVVGVTVASSTDQSRWLIVSLASLIVTIVAMSYRLKNRSQNFDNRRYEFVDQMAASLKGSLSPAARLTLALNLLPTELGTNDDTTENAPHSGAARAYDSWLTLQGELTNGTNFSLHMAEKNPVRSTTSGSDRLTNKRRRFAKSTCEITLYMKFNSQGHSSLMDMIDTARGQLKLPAWAEIKTLDLEPDSITLRVSAPAFWQVPTTNTAASVNGIELVMSMFESLHRLEMRVSRQEIKPQ